jgi:ankyrin repeat protein
MALRSIPILLEHGADINALTFTGGHCLHSCLYHGNLEACLELVKFVEKHPSIKMDTMTV